MVGLARTEDGELMLMMPARSGCQEKHVGRVVGATSQLHRYGRELNKSHQKGQEYGIVRWSLAVLVPTGVTAIVSCMARRGTESGAGASRINSRSGRAEAESCNFCGLRAQNLHRRIPHSRLGALEITEKLHRCRFELRAGSWA